MIRVFLLAFLATGPGLLESSGVPKPSGLLPAISSLYQGRPGRNAVPHASNASLAVIALDHGSGGRQPGRVACPGSQQMNTSIGVSNLHGDQISNRFALRWAGDNDHPTDRIVAYEYQTYKGREYVEFLFGPPMLFTPLKNGEIFPAFRAVIADLGVAESGLPAPFSSFSANTIFKRYECDDALTGTSR